MGRPYHLRENIPSGLSPNSKYVSFCKLFGKIIDVSNSSLSIWSGISTWQCNWKKKWMFAFDFVLLLLRRKFHIVMLWSISLLINHGAGEKKVKVAQLCPTLRPHGLYSPWNSPGQNTGLGSLSLLQGIFPTQGLNPGLPHCRWILCQLSNREARGMGGGYKMRAGTG